jgi:hypothetical protein
VDGTVLHTVDLVRGDVRVGLEETLAVDVTSALLVSPSIAAASPPGVDWQNYPGENGYTARWWTAGACTGRERWVKSI